MSHALAQELAQVREELGEARGVIALNNETIASLHAQVAQLRRLVFGQSSEKAALSVPAYGASQLDAFASECPPATDAEAREEVSEPKRERRHSPRQPLPRELPREEVVVDVPEAEKTCACCGRAKACIGQDASEKLEIVPARLYVRRIVRPRYACGHCKDAVAQAPLPAAPIAKANAGASLLAYLIVAKYADHLPLCRQERIFARAGIDMPRARTSAWPMECAELLAPLAGLMKRRVRERCEVVCADETTLDVLDPGGRKTRAAWLWAYVGDGHAPYDVFEFHGTRGRDAPRQMLEGYGGWLVADGYAAYPSLQRESRAAWKRAGCMAHVRRKFVEASRGGDTRADQAVALIGRLYDVERDAKGLSCEERLALRRERSAAPLADLRAWLDASLAVLPKSPLGKAVGYALDQWEEISRFAQDGRLPIDNNAVERAIRPVAVGRKNWLFAGSDRGGHAAATFFTLLQSARRAGANPQAWLADVLQRIAGHPMSRLEELLPGNWQPPA